MRSTLTRKQRRKLKKRGGHINRRKYISLYKNRQERDSHIEECAKIIINDKQIPIDKKKRFLWSLELATKGHNYHGVELSHELRKMGIDWQYRAYLSGTPKHRINKQQTPKKEQEVTKAVYVPPKPKKKRKYHPFYDSPEWQALRLATLRKYGCVCMKCKAKDTIMHVDHIKPRSLWPELELDDNNLQVLCEDCNLSKGNKEAIDYRNS